MHVSIPLSQLRLIAPLSVNSVSSPYCPYSLRTTASEPVTLRLISGDMTYDRTMVCATAVSVEASALVLHDQQWLGSGSSAARQRNETLRTSPQSATRQRDSDRSHMNPSGSLTAARVIAGGPTGARIIVKSLRRQVCHVNRDHDTHEDRVRQDAVSQPSSNTVH